MHRSRLNPVLFVLAIMLLTSSQKGVTKPVVSDYADMIRANPAMAAANMTNYHFCKTEYTPAPEGYEPFYISHYGRHGSRYATSDKYPRVIWPVLRKADSLGILSQQGKAFYKDFNAVMIEQTGMYGMLTGLGAQEQRGIAQRMAENFSEVFDGGEGRTRIFCQSSLSQRSIISMTNFAHSMDRCTGDLEYDFRTGDKYYQYLAFDPDQDPALKKANARVDSLRRVTMKPEDIISHFFSDTKKAYEIVGDPYKFEEGLFYASCSGHLSDHGVCLLSYFPSDILIRNWEVANRRFYSAYAMSEEMSEYKKEVSRKILADFIERAVKAVEENSDVAADFRFGHDTVLLPLVGHMRIDGMDKWASFDNVNSLWNSSVSICMASNLQLIFYRNEADDVLVKILYNEMERKIPALKSFCGPYYKWDDLKKYLLSLD